jgi:hypothetical protein
MVASIGSSGIEMRVDERECKNSAARKTPLELTNQIEHFGQTDVAENRISQDVIELLSCLRQSQSFCAVGIEGKVVPVIEDPVRVGIPAPAFLDSLFRNVDAPVSLMIDG